MATRIVIIGGGPAGYEAALVAAARGPDVAEVTVVDCDGIGGACVLWDCVPSKTFIASTGRAHRAAPRVRPRRTTSHIEDAEDLAAADPQPRQDAGRSRSPPISPTGCAATACTLIDGRGELVDAVPGMAQHRVKVTEPDGTDQRARRPTSC